VAFPFHTWASNVADLKRLALAAAKIIIRWQTIALSRPWSAWVDRSKEKKRLARTAARVLRTWNACHLAPAFHKWVEEHSRINAMALAGAKVLLRWRKMLISHSLSTWLEVVRTSHMTAKVLTRWSCKCMLGAFCLWSDHVHAQKQAHACGLAAVKKMLNKSTAMAFAAWAAAHTDCKRLQAAAVRVVYRWQQMTMAAPFATWHDHVDETKTLKHAAEKVVNRWTAMSMAVPFFTWLENVHEKLKLKRAAAKIMARWRLVDLARPWLAWCDRIAHKKHLERAAERTLRRWSKTDKAPAFGAWKENYLAARHAKLSSSKIIKRWKGVSVAATFARWCEQVTRQTTLVAAAHKVMARWLNVGLVQHFEHWLILLEDRKWAEQVKRNQSNQEVSTKRLATLSVDCERLANEIITERLQKDEMVKLLQQQSQTLLDQVSDLEKQNLLNWTRWTETRRAAEQQAESLMTERIAESEKLANLKSKYEILQSDVTYLQTRLDAKRVMVDLLRGNLSDSERLARGLLHQVAIAVQEAASISVKNTRINGTKPAVLLGTSNGHAFNDNEAPSSSSSSTSSSIATDSADLSGSFLA
jgi:hypothetical protein